MEAVFLAVGTLGLVVLVLSLLVGEIAELGEADGPFSVPALAALLGGVGFGGAAAASLLPGTLPGALVALLALAAGAAVAVPLAWGVVRLARGLRDMPTAETPTRSSVAGAQGVVVTAIRRHGYGEVRIVLAGQQVKFTARSDVALPAGTPVYVVEVLSDTAVQVVSTAPDPLPGLPGQPEPPETGGDRP